MTVEQIAEWALRPEDDRQIAALLARAFDDDFGGRSYYRTRQHLRLVHRQAAIVAHMALQFRAMRLGGRLITVAGLADVATDAAWRGRGLASALLATAVELARASPADHMALFGTARLYHAAGFRPVHNPMIWTDMTGAVSGAPCHEPAESLMVLPLRGAAWDATAPLDLLGTLF